MGSLKHGDQDDSEDDLLEDVGDDGVDEGHLGVHRQAGEQEEDDKTIGQKNRN